MADASERDNDRMWLVTHYVVYDVMVTPYIGVTFGRYWRVCIGIGPFYTSFGYVQTF